LLNRRFSSEEDDTEGENVEEEMEDTVDAVEDAADKEEGDPNPPARTPSSGMRPPLHDVAKGKNRARLLLFFILLSLIY
jgi:hypothetical protein